MNIEEKDVAAAIVSARDHLVHFHVSDNDRGVPGSGHVPWTEVRRGLADIAYDRWIVAEMFVVAGNPASADLNIWRDIEPDASRAAARTLVVHARDVRVNDTGFSPPSPADSGSRG